MQPGRHTYRPSKATKRATSATATPEAIHVASTAQATSAIAAAPLGGAERRESGSEENRSEGDRVGCGSALIAMRVAVGVERCLDGRAIVRRSRAGFGAAAASGREPPRGGDNSCSRARALSPTGARERHPTPAAPLGHNACMADRDLGLELPAGLAASARLSAAAQAATASTPAASPEEAAAIVAALERFMGATAPPPASTPDPSTTDPWRRAAAREALTRAERHDLPDPWINT